MRLTAAFLALSAAAWAASAQPIERVKMTDNDLSCRQMHDEITAMDKIVTEAKTMQSEGESTALAGQAGAVAAEVASRTGLFAQMGGLFGHIAGTVASKAAADLAGQSGRRTAQEAKERESQALARKEHLASLFLAKGCKASDPDAPAANPTASVPLKMAAAETLPLDEVIRRAAESAVPVGGELGLQRHRVGVAAAQRVFIPNFRVAFTVKTVATASAGAGLANIGSSTASVSGMRTITQAQSKRVEIALAGADRVLLQALTDRLYTDFVARLKASGREVIDWEQVKRTPGFEKLVLVTENPYAVSPWTAGDKRGYLVMRPTDMPLFFVSTSETHIADRIVDLQTQRAVAEMAANLDAVALIPTLQIDIAEIRSSGDSRWRADAEADLTPKLGIVDRSVLFFSNGRDAKIFYDGEFGWVRVEKPFYVEGEFGTVRTVESFDTASLANAITMATGAQGVQRFDEKRELRVDPLKFASGVMKVGATFNDSMVAAIKP